MNEAEKRRRRFGLRPQLLLLLFLLNLVAAVAYSTLLYMIDRREIITGIDNKLRTAAHAVHEILPEDYHPRVHGPDSIAPAEFDRLQQTLSRFADRAGLVEVVTRLLGQGRVDATEIEPYRRPHFSAAAGLLLARLLAHPRRMRDAA